MTSPVQYRIVLLSKASPDLPPSFLVKYISGKLTYNSDSIGATLFCEYTEAQKQCDECQDQLIEQGYQDDFVHVEACDGVPREWRRIRRCDLDDVISDLLVV